uniref:Uncharacterized protein n=1 Tax=Arundo donax TaxID=35708 RepID=A0A0A9GYY1_ARUDO
MVVDIDLFPIAEIDARICSFIKAHFKQTFKDH